MEQETKETVVFWSSLTALIIGSMALMFVWDNRQFTQIVDNVKKIAKKILQNNSTNL